MALDSALYWASQHGRKTMADSAILLALNLDSTIAEVQHVAFQHWRQGMVDRRRFLFSWAAVAATVGLHPAITAAAVDTQCDEYPPLPPKGLYDRDPEAYWRSL